jgi:hypothetical protein
MCECRGENSICEACFEKIMPIVAILFKDGVYDDLATCIRVAKLFIAGNLKK